MVKSEVYRFLTFFLNIWRRGAFGCCRCGVFSICRTNNRKGKPAAAAKERVGAKNSTKTGEKGLKSEFSPFFCTFGVGVLSGGLGAASFPPVEQTISKVSQQRRQKRELGIKNRPKTGEKGLKSQVCRFLTFFLHIRRRGALGWPRCGVFSTCRANHCKGKPAAAAKKEGG